MCLRNTRQVDNPPTQAQTELVFRQYAVCFYLYQPVVSDQGADFNHRAGGPDLGEKLPVCFRRIVPE